VTGGRVVRTLPGAPERWYALGGEPALTNAGIASAGTATDVSGEPAVTLEFTQEGRAAFGSLTREHARRGEERNAWQHLAIVLDDRIVAIPFIDFREDPEGIVGPGALISDGLSPESAWAHRGDPRLGPAAGGPPAGREVATREMNWGSSR
jgi:preprotein translocase subunit SecD